MSTDLSTWLEQQIAQDERIAREAVEHENGNWWSVVHEGCEGIAVYALKYSKNVDGQRTPTTVHIETWDPRRVLAECAAKRLAIKEYRTAVEMYDVPVERALRVSVLQPWATAYAARPGFQEQWRTQ